MSNQKIVLILGAGCSVNCGYPTADRMKKELHTFLETLDEKDAPLLKGMGQEVLTIMDQLQAPSLDRLALLVLDKKADVALGVSSNLEYGKRYLFLDRAKAFVRAYFLSLEQKAWNSGVPGYADLAISIRTEAGKEGLADALKRTRYRVISFNYDCCFEMACLMNWPVNEDDHLYSSELLNTGVVDLGGNASWNSDRFTYLKAHGSIKMLAYYNPIEETQFVHRYGPYKPWSDPLKDQFYFRSDTSKTEPVDSAIFFPCEREHLTGTADSIRPPRAYAKQLLQRLKQTCSEASAIRLIGHSASDQDVPYLREMFADAHNCERWEVHNLPGAANAVRDRLITLLDVPKEKICVTEVAFGGSARPDNLLTAGVGDSFR